MKKIIFLNFSLSLVIIAVVMFYYSNSIKSVHRINYEIKLKILSSEIVKVLQYDSELLSLNKYAAYTKGDYPGVDFSKKDEIKSFLYRDLRNQISSNMRFFKCESTIGPIFVREKERNTLFGDIDYSYEVYALSSDKLIESNVFFQADIDSMPWMKYNNLSDIGEWRPCYPWENLEKYNKIHMNSNYPSWMKELGIKNKNEISKILEIYENTLK